MKQVSEPKNGESEVEEGGKCTVDLVGNFEKPIGRFPIKETSKQRHLYNGVVSPDRIQNADSNSNSQCISYLTNFK